MPLLAIRPDRTSSNGVFDGDIDDLPLFPSSPPPFPEKSKKPRIKTVHSLPLKIKWSVPKFRRS